LKRSLATLLAVGLLLPVVACWGSDSTGPKDPSELNFDPALGVNLDQMTKTSSGLYWQDLVVGDGDEAEAGGWVTVHYTGWLHSGARFDTSVGGDPIRFSLDQVIPGWAEGVPGMKVGGKRKLVVPPHLGYGPSGRGPIPSNATLVFDVELLGVG
jgi:FKBP-type peptidyl-prolyl cis-trans isomerase FkpA